MNDPTTIERAFEIAKSGEVANIGELRHRLSLEGRDDVGAHLSSSPSLGRQLIAIMRASMPLA